MNRIYLLGFDFLDAEFSEVLGELRGVRSHYADYLPFLITPNSDQLLHFNGDSYSNLKVFFQRSYFVLPDGMPIVLFSKLVKKPLRKRLAGSDLFPQLWEQSIKDRKKILVVAPSEKVAENLKSENPFMEYHIPGFLQVDDKAGFEHEANLILAACERVMPEYVMIGLGFPKQEILGKMLYEKLSGRGGRMPLFLLLGASFEFYVGMKRRAPSWMQNSGLEWLHRLMSEPRRLFKRYTIGNFRVIIFLVKCYIQNLTKGI